MSYFCLLQISFFFFLFIAAMLYNGLSVEARTTAGWTKDMPYHRVLQEYIAGAIGKYLLVIEYIISQYPELNVIVSSVGRMLSVLIVE
jgi:hypothetical protein